MTKKKMYRYLGRNGIITSPVLLDNIEHIDMFHLIADNKKLLTNGEEKVKSVTIFADELDNWTEVNED